MIFEKKIVITIIIRIFFDDKSRFCSANKFTLDARLTVSKLNSGLRMKQCEFINFLINFLCSMKLLAHVVFTKVLLDLKI